MSRNGLMAVNIVTQSKRIPISEQIHGLAHKPAGHNSAPERTSTGDKSQGHRGVAAAAVSRYPPCTQCGGAPVKSRERDLSGTCPTYVIG